MSNYTNENSVAKRSLLCILFILAVFQILDLHSTLTKSINQTETNPAINRLAEYIGFTYSVCFFKLLAFFCIYVIYRVTFKTFPEYTKQVCFFLSPVALFYVVIIFNNYIHH